MGYNPTAWNTRRIDNLWIPQNVLLEHGFHVWRSPSVPEDTPVQYVLTLPDRLGECDIAIDDYNPDSDEVRISEFLCDNIYRDGYEIIEEILKKSLGFIEYVLVWEGGDSVAIHTWKNGKEETEIII